MKIECESIKILLKILFSFPSIVSASTQNAQDDGVEVFPSIVSASTQNAQDDGVESFWFIKNEEQMYKMHLFIHNLYF